MKQIIRPKERQDGLWLDIERKHYRTILTNRISPENVHDLIEKLAPNLGR